MKVAKAKGRLRGKQPKLTERHEALLVTPHRSGEHTTAERSTSHAPPSIARSSGPGQHARLRRRINSAANGLSPG
jgi:hypothetical protein